MVATKALDRLQPALLDRLTDDEPEHKEESRDKRVLSMRRLREAVLRDLRWLLNTGNLTGSDPSSLDAYPTAARSVINYGIPTLSGYTVATMDLASLERTLKQAISDFEPRILKKDLRISAVEQVSDGGRSTLSFTIEGRLWAQPAPQAIFLKTELDLELGDVQVSDYGQATR